MSSFSNRNFCNPHLGKPAYVTASAPCVKVVSPCQIEPLPQCVSTIFAENTSVVLGQFQKNASDIYIANDARQGSLNFTAAGGWKLTVNGVVYSGSSEKAQISGLYTNSSGQNILMKTC